MISKLLFCIRTMFQYVKHKHGQSLGDKLLMVEELIMDIPKTECVVIVISLYVI